MPTDDERRRVAERLRGISRDVRFWGGVDPLHYIKKGVFGDVDRHDPNETIDRLADLIEPSCDAPQKAAEEMFGKMRHSTKEEADAHDAMLKSKSVEIHPVDRDALLELAAEMGRKSDDGSWNPDPMRPLASSLDLFGYARRIREACGVVE